MVEPIARGAIRQATDDGDLTQLMDMTWMGVGMAVWTILLIVLVAALAYLCFEAGRYFQARARQHNESNSTD